MTSMFTARWQLGRTTLRCRDVVRTLGGCRYTNGLAALRAFEILARGRRLESEFRAAAATDGGYGGSFRRWFFVGDCLLGFAVRVRYGSPSLHEHERQSHAA